MPSDFLLARFAKPHYDDVLLTRDNLCGDPVRNSMWSNSGRACREAARGGNYGDPNEA